MLAVGNAPLSWGVFEGDAETNPPWATVLDEIVAAGYRRLELGPIGFLPENTAVLGEALAERGLSLTAGFVYEHMHDPANRDMVMRNTKRVGEVLSALGARYLVIIDRMVIDRRRTAGRSDAAERLDDEGWKTMIGTIGEVARSAEELGLRPVLHPHCGTHIEFSDEIERALIALPTSVGLCIDTAHSTVAGIDPLLLVEQYESRLEYFHLKDVDGRALAAMREEELEFEQALAIGLFCPLGKGVVDFAGLADVLRQIGFAGSATVEQDPDPRVRDYSGFTAAQQSSTFLREVGLMRDEGPQVDGEGDGTHG